MLQYILTAALLLTAPSAAAGDDPWTYRGGELGVSISLPGKDWKLNDMSKGSAKVLLFSPMEDMSIRCCILYMPSEMLPEGLISREKQIQALLKDGYKRTAYETAKLGGREARLLEYQFKETTVREYGLSDGDFFLMFQLCAPDGEWAEDEMLKILEGILASFTFTGDAKIEKPEADFASPDEVRARRAEANKRQKFRFEVSHHDIAAEIDPCANALTVRDRITIRARVEGVAKIRLYFTVVEIARVEPEGRVAWSTEPGGPGVEVLVLRFDPPLARDEETRITVHTGSDDYIQKVDQSLVQEISVFGQVREESSWSSHIVWYPMDERNDAAMDIALSVPEGYTAVTGGVLVGKETGEGRVTYRYRTTVRKPRLLPFGFAAAKYIQVEGESKGGLPITVYGYPGEETLIRQRLDVALESAALFERMMGPLPFEGVRFAHVTPVDREMGVSLPGLILISDGFFGDLSGVDLSDGGLDRPDALSLLVVADELSHQWNFYSVPLPNELAEGVSTFTNTLLVEHRHGKEAYRNALGFCAKAYHASASIAKDIAVADPAIYRTDAYRGIAFCKVPVILDMLRGELGDELFFEGWRKAFQKFDPDHDGYEILERAFTEVAGRDLSWFFEQWFFQAGCPEISVEHVSSGSHVSVIIEQVQPRSPYRLKAEFDLLGVEGQSRRETVEIVERKTRLEIDVGFAVREVTFDPDGRLIWKKVER